ncbi:type II secretion system F family protein [Gracilibacillus caseinilyticus]|uniref:Type II secretion system F family protein n=1 Tax=Gracilibacillus caseinilyticus TaxID=2932256 RepID=A0ABY4EZL1_9BACI|nr:type II secretion system F family protein [Gracilibacillus caseinilyticus]UOQ49725.1 type II secretion system F family protein [Gracilibacillus caseinilyticus]
MIATIMTILATLCFILFLAYWLDYRRAKRNWRKSTEDFYKPDQERKSFIVLIGDRYDHSETAQPMFEKLKQANIPFTPSEFIAAQFVAFMGIILLLVNMFNLKLLISAFLALLLLEGGKRIMFAVRKNKMHERLVDQLPEICRILANSTRSGMTLNQGIQMVAQEIAAPAKTEFKQLAHELSLGIPFDIAIKKMESRIDNKEFKLFVATVLIQKKAGGNISSILDEMSQTLEDRKLLKQEIKTMTAEQRYVAILVPIIPIFLVLMMNNIIDGFLDPLFTGIGLLLLLFFILGTGLTFWLVRKVTNIRV